MKTVKTNLNEDDFEALSGINGESASEKLKNSVKLASKPIDSVPKPQDNSAKFEEQTP